MPKMMVLLKHTRLGALKAWMKRQREREKGTDYPMPIEFKFLYDTMPRYPRKHDKYYTDGGVHWPDRWVINA